MFTCGYHRLLYELVKALQFPTVATHQTLLVPAVHVAIYETVTTTSGTGT